MADYIRLNLAFVNEDEKACELFRRWAALRSETNAEFSIWLMKQALPKGETLESFLSKIEALASGGGKEPDTSNK